MTSREETSEKASTPRSSSDRSYDNSSCGESFPPAALTEAVAPWLPPSHIVAHLPLCAACTRLDRRARNWNEEFQRLWAEDRLQVWGTDAHELLDVFIREFEEYAFTLAESLCRDGRDSAVWSARAQSVTDTFRVGNLLLRIWRDDKLGLNTQRCFRALLDARAPILCFPLSAAFRYFNVSVTVQAIVPLAAGRPPLYRGDGAPDPLLNRPLLDTLSFLFEALNILPHDSGAAAKQPGIEVHEGLDLRLYIMNPLGLLPPMFPGLGRTGPLRRWWHIVRNPPAHFMHVPTAAYERAVVSMPFLLSDVFLEVGVRRHRSLVRVLHQHGLNVCLLGVIAQHVLSQADGNDDDDDEGRESLLRLIGIEMLARAARRVMFLQATLDRASLIPRVADTYLARTIAALMEADPDRFLYGLSPTVREMFCLNTDDVVVQEYLLTTLRNGTLQVTKRLCSLSGFALNHGVVERMECLPSAHNFSSYLDMNHESAVSAFVLDNARERDATRGLLTSLILPQRMAHDVRSGHIQQALSRARRIVAVRARTKRRFLYIEALVMASAVAAHAGDFEAALTMVRHAQDEMNNMPLMERGVATLTGPRVELPRRNRFLMGQILVAIACGLLQFSSGDLTGARSMFLHATGLNQFISPECVEYTTSLSLQSFGGLIEVAYHSDVVTVPELLNLWGKLRRRLGPSEFGSRICTQLATLLLQRGMYEEAAERLRDALEVVAMLFGDQSYEAAVLLNKLAFVYYTWDVTRFGVLCSCLLQLAETVLVETKGEYSVSHLCVVENIVLVLMMRGNFVSASRRLIEVVRPSPRTVVARIPRDHPVTLRLYETLERLQMLFKPTAVVLIQRHWREYRRRLAVKSVFEVNACLVQRVGRGLIGRKLLMHFSRSGVSLDELHRRDAEFLRQNFSQPLLRASQMLSKKHRNWSGELQHYHQTDFMWDAVSAATRREHIGGLQRDFHAMVLEGIRLFHESPKMISQVPGCSTSFVVENIVITRVSADDEQTRIEYSVSSAFRNSPSPFLTSTLTDYVEVNGATYFAQALIPVHRRIRIVLTHDGRTDDSDGPETAEMIRTVIGELFWVISKRDDDSMDDLRGIEIVKAMDEMWYVTIGIGFVTGYRDRLDTIDELLCSSPYWRALRLCSANQQSQAVTLMEQYIISRKWKDATIKFLAQAFLAYMFFAANSDIDTASKLLQAAFEALHSTGWLDMSGILLYVHARGLIRVGQYARASDLLLQQNRLLQESRFHAYYAAFRILDNARWLARASRRVGKPLPRSVISFTHHAVTFSEPTELLFETCTILTRLCMHTGELQLAEAFAAVLERKVKELDQASGLRYAKALLGQSQVLFRRGGVENYEASATLLLAAIRIVETAQPASLPLGIMLNNYGSLLTHLNNLPAARKALLSSRQLLSRYVGRENQEMISWRKNMKILENRQRQSAATRIQRAVRHWLERRAADRRLGLEDPERHSVLVRHRLVARLKHLIVGEATARILVADEENEAHYVLFTRQRRMLGNAKMATILRETCGARVGIHRAKIATSFVELCQLEESIRGALCNLQGGLRAAHVSQCIMEQYRLGRRVIIRDNNAKRVGLRLWYMETIQPFMRLDLLRAYMRIMLRYVEREEVAWRAYVKTECKETKRALGHSFGRALKKCLHGRRQKRRKNVQRLIDDLLIEEQIHREKIIAREAQISRDFFYGPLVDSEEDEDSMGTLESWQ